MMLMSAHTLPVRQAIHSQLTLSLLPRRQQWPDPGERNQRGTNSTPAAVSLSSAILVKFAICSQEGPKPVTKVVIGNKAQYKVDGWVA